MNSIGIRISDKKDSVITVKLSDILELIDNGDSIYWSILFSEVAPKRGEGEFTSKIEMKADNAPNGLQLRWEELKIFSGKIHQEIDLRVIGSKNLSNLKRYSSDVELYNSCDFVIEMVDTSYWEVFSKDHNLINRLAKEFKDTEFLSPDWNAKP